MLFYIILQRSILAFTNHKVLSVGWAYKTTSPFYDKNFDKISCDLQTSICGTHRHRHTEPMKSTITSNTKYPANEIGCNKEYQISSKVGINFREFKIPVLGTTCTSITTSTHTRFTLDNFSLRYKY